MRKRRTKTVRPDGHLISDMIADLGLNRDEFALLAGVSPRTVDKVVAGDTVRRETLQAIAKALKVEVTKIELIENHSTEGVKLYQTDSAENHDPAKNTEIMPLPPINNIINIRNKIDLSLSIGMDRVPTTRGTEYLEKSLEEAIAKYQDFENILFLADNIDRLDCRIYLILGGDNEGRKIFYFIVSPYEQEEELIEEILLGKFPKFSYALVSGYGEPHCEEVTEKNYYFIFQELYIEDYRKITDLDLGIARFDSKLKPDFSIKLLYVMYHRKMTGWVDPNTHWEQ